jgi:hypothetical protein
MLFAACQGQEHVKPMGFEREETPGCQAIFHNPIYIMKYIYDVVAEVKPLAKPAVFLPSLVQSRSASVSPPQRRSRCRVLSFHENTLAAEGGFCPNSAM